MAVRTLVARYFQSSRLQRHRLLQVFALIALSLLAIDTILTLRASADQPLSDNCGIGGYGPNEPPGYQHFTASDCSQAMPETVSDVAPWTNTPLTITASGGRFAYWAGWTYSTTTYGGQNIPCGNQSITVTFSRPVLSVRVQPGTFGGGVGYRSTSLTVSDNVGNSVVITKAPAAADFPRTALTAPFPGPGITSVVLTANDGLAFTLGLVEVLTPENDCYAVKSLEMVAINSPLDTNPNAGAGQRIFPDKLTPTDAVDRKRVRIKAYTASGPNKTIYFRSFDLDDPSSGTSPIDPNDTSGPTGGDNRGAPTSGTMSAVGGTGTTNIVSAVTDSSGIAQADLTVSMQPGDNFIVAANADLNYLNGVVVDGSNLREPYANNLLPSFRVQVTPMLTVWRKLHVEVDSMGNVSGNQATGRTSSVTPNTTTNQTAIAASTTLDVNRFENGRIILNNVGMYPVVSNTANTITVQGIINSVPKNTSYTLYDDDDFNTNNGTSMIGDNGEDVVALSQTFSRIQTSDNPEANVFAPAYIRPAYDGGGNSNNDSGTITFALNVTDNATAIVTQLNRGRSSGANEGDSFWVVYIQVAYQPDKVHDFDPDTEPAVGGTTSVYAMTDDVTSSAGVPRGGDGSLVFMETMRDRVRFPASILDTIAVPHEIGHQFGLRGDAAGFGIMFNSSEPPTFVDRHLNVLRWRVKSPGQL